MEVWQMSTLSAELTQWLDKILSEDTYPPSTSDNEDYDDDSDPTKASFDGSGRRIIWYFPEEDIYQEYLAAASDRPEEEIRKVIRRLLIPPGATGADHIIFEAYVSLRDREYDNDEEKQRSLEWMNSDRVQRVVRYYGGETNNPPWEGMTWILNLLPDHPRPALDAIEAYFLAHMAGLTDHMIHALGDAEGIIRARYIGLPESSSGRLVTLAEISWREFEQLVEHLYAEKGYETELTGATRDGGRDIIATLSGPGKQERILISCKQSRNKIGVRDVRELDSVTTRESANKGTLVTNSDFTPPARTEFAGYSRIELINGAELIVLLNENLGWTWPARIEYFTRNRPFRVAHPEP
jgi:restriction system protein